MNVTMTIIDYYPVGEGDGVVMPTRNSNRKQQSSPFVTKCQQTSFSTHLTMTKVNKYELEYFIIL
jgi:hypothetical protein